jgi:predicted kinase
MKAVLYLMIGFPGAGKTTTSRVIHELTGAVHIWADQERNKMFGIPSYSNQENIKLYDHLNYIANQLLKDGKSVIFDTNFNFRSDRDKLRKIASKNDAKCQVVWVKVDKSLALKRATQNAHLQDTRILGNIPKSDFERMTNNLEPPNEDESPIVVDGTKVTTEYIRKIFGL